MEARIRRAAIFQGVDATAATALVRRLPKHNFASGTVIFAEGEPGEKLYIIVTGLVKIGRRGPGGRQCLISILGISEVFGDLAVFDPGPRGATATALTDVWAVSVDRADMRTWIAEHPTAAGPLLALLAQRLRRTYNDISEQLFVDVPGRVVTQLLQLSQRLGTREPDGIRVPVGLTASDIAQLVGSTQTAVSEVLADFNRRGWIRMDDDGLLISDAASLAAGPAIGTT